MIRLILLWALDSSSEMEEREEGLYFRNEKSRYCQL